MTRESPSVMVSGNGTKDRVKDSALAVIDRAAAEIRRLLRECVRDSGDLPMTVFTSKEGLEAALQEGIIVHTLFSHTVTPEYIVLLRDGLYHMRSKYVHGEPRPVYDSRSELHRQYIDYWQKALELLPTKK